MEPIVGCCDVGGSTLRVALARRDGGLLAQRDFTHSHPDPGAMVELIARTLDELSPGLAAELVAVGVSVPGPLDPEQGIVQLSPNLGWREFPLAEELSGRLGLHVKIDDDANCAALGEQWRGAGQSVCDLLYVIVGTGIGAGLVLDGKLYHGARGWAGELGHTTIVPDGPVCSCGNHGCLEALAAGPAIAKRYNDLGSNPPNDLTARQVIAAARAGDLLASQVLTLSGQYLGLGLANATNLLNPELIILGGGVANDAGELLMAPARQVLRERALRAASDSVELVLGALGEDAGLIGAARLAWDT